MSMAVRAILLVQCLLPCGQYAQKGTQHISVISHKVLLVWHLPDQKILRKALMALSFLT